MKHVTFHLPSFLRRVRIHGGEFDSSARAMNREEQVRLFQAEPRIVRGSTIERKQMSTKTTIKRIALVSVAALGFGVLSVVPSNATASAGDFTISAATASQLTGETATATSVVATLSYAVTATTDTATITASLFSAKNADGTTMTSGLAQPRIDVADTTTAQVYKANVTSLVVKAANGTGVAADYIGNDVAANVVPTANTGVVVAKFRVYLDAPTKAGTYVVKLTPTIASGSTAGSLQAAAAQTVTITVTAAPADDLVAASATSILNAGETNSATADVAVTSTRSQAAVLANTVAAATIAVTLKNKSALAAAESFTATLSGPGILGSATPAVGSATVDAPNPTARILTVKNGDVVQVFPDGTSGVATITIASLLGVELAKETVTFFGAAATLTATVKKPVLGGTTAVAEVLEVVVKDSAGVSVSNLAGAIGVVSSDTAKIATTYSATSTYSATTGSYLVSVTPVAAGSANLTVTTKTAAAATGVDAAAAVSVRVGGAKSALDGLTLATDKTSYAPGEVVTLTVTPLDKDGLILADETHTVFTAAGIVSTHSVTSPAGSNFSLVQTGAQDGGLAGTGTKLGVATYKFYAPNIEGDMKLSWTRSTEFATAANDSLVGSITIAVSSPGTAAATDAANEATDAANAATDQLLLQLKQQMLLQQQLRKHLMQLQLFQSL